MSSQYFVYRHVPLYRRMARLHRHACRHGLARPNRADVCSELGVATLREVFEYPEGYDYSYLRFDREGLDALAQFSALSDGNIVGVRDLAAAYFNSHAEYSNSVLEDYDDTDTFETPDEFTFGGEFTESVVSMRSAGTQTLPLRNCYESGDLGFLERELLFLHPWHPRGSSTVGDVFAELADSSRPVTDLIDPTTVGGERLALMLKRDYGRHAVRHVQAVVGLDDEI